MTFAMTTLGEVLRHASRFNAAHYLYLPMDEAWRSSTKCAVLPQSDVDGVPTAAEENGLSYAVGVSAIQDVVANAKQQIGEVTLDQLLHAFLFYYDNDAFISFGN